MLSMEMGATYGAHLLATEAIPRGHVIHTIDPLNWVDEATYQTVQVRRDKHVMDTGVLAYLNHSCRPTTEVDTTALVVTALRDIAPGEELTFFYPATEWDMDRPFVCRCAAAQCVRLVAGARYLSVDVLSRYTINAHIRELIQQTLDAPRLVGDPTL